MVRSGSRLSPDLQSAHVGGTAEAGGSSPLPAPKSGRPGLRQAPKIADQVQALEDCLVLVSCVRPPVAIKTILIPRETKFDDFDNRNGGSWLALT